MFVSVGFCLMSEENFFEVKKGESEHWGEIKTEKGITLYRSKDLSGVCEVSKLQIIKWKKELKIV